MAIEYKILLKIELLSDYFNDEKSRHLQIVPTAATEKLLHDQNILCRQLSNKFILLAKIDNTGKPFTTLDPATVFKFYLKIDDYPFLQYTSLPFDPAGNQRYYFTNLHSNAVGSKNYISKPFDTIYNNTLTYNPGDRVLNDNVNKEVFEAIRKSSNADQHALSETTYWFKRTTAALPKQFVNNADLITMSGRSYKFHIASPAQKATVTISKFNAATNTFNQAAQAPVDIEFEAPGQQDIPVDFSNLPSGRYNVSVSHNGTDESKIIYYDEQVFENGVLGIIDIHCGLPAASPYAFIDAAQKIKEPEVVYTLRFASKIAYWRYIARTGSVIEVKEKTSVHVFNADGPLKFRSVNPLAFSEKPFNILINYKKDAGSPNIEIEGMKNGTYQNLRQIELAPQEKFDCSEIYLNY